MAGESLGCVSRVRDTRPDITADNWACADYLGQKSIVSIPYISYSVGNVVASVVIACVAVIVALYIMFIVLRPKLKHGWLIKVAIACILGAAVCCMHYTAMGGESLQVSGERARADLETSYRNNIRAHSWCHPARERIWWDKTDDYWNRCCIGHHRLFQHLHF